MSVVVGPVLVRPGGYAFDIWTVEHGVSRGYVYRRFEDARYARDALVERATNKGRSIDGAAPLSDVCACSTLDQFMAELVERGALVTDGLLQALHSLQLASMPRL